MNINIFFSLCFIFIEHDTLKEIKDVQKLVPEAILSPELQSKMFILWPNKTRNHICINVLSISGGRCFTSEIEDKTFISVVFIHRCNVWSSCWRVFLAVYHGWFHLNITI